MGWTAILVQILTGLLKAIFGTDKPRTMIVEHPKPEVEVSDGKDRDERLKDLGL